MSRSVRITGIVIFILLIGFLAFELWLSGHFKRLLNKNPDRAYEIEYASLSLHPLLRGATLKDVTIEPIRLDDSSTVINASVHKARISGISWRQLIFKKRAKVRAIDFVRPEITVAISSHPAHRNKASTNVQSLFSDVLSRADLHDFKLIDGSANVYLAGSDGQLKSQFRDIFIHASGLETDSLQWQHTIPFKLESINTKIGEVDIQVDEYTKFSTGNITYDFEDAEISIMDMQLRYDRPWEDISKILGTQIDLIEFELDELRLEGVTSTSSLYGEYDIEAAKLVIEGMDFRDRRDKNQPRPPDSEKPMFQGMVQAIPFPITVDSVIITNSNIEYSEIGEGKDEAGNIKFNAINGHISTITSDSTRQAELGHFTAKLQARFNDQAPMYVTLEIPYDREAFHLDTRITSFDLVAFNPTLIPMANIEVTSGTIDNLYLKMTASRTSAVNSLVLDYSDLDIAVVRELEHHHIQSRPFLSTIAAAAIRSQNLPDDNNYVLAEYTSERNIYRAPYNFIWNTLKDGFLSIVPTKAIRTVMGSNTYKEMESQKSEKKKHHKRHKKK